MKTRLRKNHSAMIPTSRWLAYAGAGAATALVSAATADAEIHYSGPVAVAFEADESKTVPFSLDQPGDSMVFKHDTFNGAGMAYFKAVGLRSGAFLGTYSNFSYAYVFRLRAGQPISEGPFTSQAGSGFNFGIMVDESGGSHGIGKWKKRGIGFVGFRFNNGTGVQYGWARVQMGTRINNFRFKVLDYAYADPGESIDAGQTTSGTTDGLAEGSLGWLAVGAAGLAALRRKRRQAAPGSWSGY